MSLTKILSQSLLDPTGVCRPKLRCICTEKAQNPLLLGLPGETPLGLTMFSKLEIHAGQSDIWDLFQQSSKIGKLFPASRHKGQFDPSRLITEIRILRRLEGVPTPRLLEFGPFPNMGYDYALVLDRVPGTVYYDAINTRLESPFTERLGPQLLHEWSQCCSAVETVHRHGVAHLDLNPSNWIVSATHHLILIDFGSSAHHATFSDQPVTIDPIDPLRQFFSKNYDQIPPELQHAELSDARSLDIWLLGHMFEQILMVFDAHFGAPFKTPCHLFAPDLNRTLCAMKTPRPTHRPSLETLAHDWHHPTYWLTD